MNYAFVTLTAVVCYIMSADIYTPCMPAIAAEFQETSSDVQFTLTVFLAGSLLAALFSGLFSDRVGRKKTFVLSQVISFMGSLICIFAPNLSFLILGCLLQGTAITGMVIGLATIQELYSKDEAIRIFGLIGALMVAIPSAAPFAGGVINDYLGWRFVFVFTAFSFGLSIVMSSAYLPSSMNLRKFSGLSLILKSIGRILTNRNFLAYGLLSPLMNAAMWFYLAFLPFYAQVTLNVSATLYGAVVGIVSMFYALGSTLGSPLTRRYGTDGAINCALGLVLSGSVFALFVAYAFADSFILINVSIALFLVGFGILFPTSVAKTLSYFQEDKTIASSIRVLIITIFALTGTAWAKYVNDTWLYHLPLTMLVISGISFMVFNLRTEDNTD